MALGVGLVIASLFQTLPTPSIASDPEIPWAGTRGVTPTTGRKRMFGSPPAVVRKAKIGAGLVIQVIVRRDGSVEVEELLGCRVWKWGKKPDEKLAGHCPELLEAARPLLEAETFRPALYEGRPIDCYVAVTREYDKKPGKGPHDIWTDAEFAAMLPDGVGLNGEQRDGAPPDALPPLIRPAAALPREESWREVRTKNFTVYSNAEESDARLTGRRLETLREVLRRRHGGDSVHSPRSTAIYLFRDELSFAPYTVGASAGGYFIEAYDGNFLAIQSSWWLGGAIYHEYLHYFLANNLPRVPVWLNEGIAELYSNFSVRDQEASYGGPVRHHIEVLRSQPLIPLEQLFTVTTDSETYNESERKGLFYAQSWALTHYLMMGRLELTPKLTEFLERTGKGEEPDAAFQAAFATSYEAMLEQLKAYLDEWRFPWVSIRFEDLDVNLDAETRELSRAETLTHLGILLLHADPEKPDGPAEHFRSAIALQPELAIAHRGMGVFHDEAGDRKAALESLSEAARLDPGDDLTLFLRAKLLLDATIESSDGAAPRDLSRLPEVKRLLKKATELNPERGDSFRLLGLALTMEGNCDEGPQVLKQAWNLMPSEMSIPANLAGLLGICGETESANYIVETFLEPYVDTNEVKEVKQLVGAGELESELAAARELAMQGQEAEAEKKLESLLARVEEPELRSRIETSLAQVRKALFIRSFNTRFDEAVEASRSDEPERASELLLPLLHNIEALGLGETEQGAKARLEVSGFIDCMTVQIKLMRAYEMYDTGEFLEALALLDETERDIDRFLAKPTAEFVKTILERNKAALDREREDSWDEHYRKAVSIAVNDDRAKGTELIREIIERCPYPDTVASARKALAQLTR